MYIIWFYNNYYYLMHGGEVAGVQVDALTGKTAAIPRSILILKRVSKKNW
jgi:hypothetical protein